MEKKQVPNTDYTMDTSLFKRAEEQLIAYYDDLVRKVFSLLRHRNVMPVWVNVDPKRVADITVKSMCKAFVYSDTTGTFGIHETRFAVIMQAELNEYRIESVQRFVIDDVYRSAPIQRFVIECVCALRDILNGKVGESNDD